MFDDALLSMPEPGEVDTDELLAGIAAGQGMINKLTAAQFRLVAEFAHRRPAPAVAEVPGGDRARSEGVSEFAAAEIGCVLGLTARGADLMLGTALAMEHLPGTAAAFRAGHIDLRRARAMQDATFCLPHQAAVAVEAAVLPRAAEQTVPQLGRAARRAVLRLSPRTAEEGHQATLAERCI